MIGQAIFILQARSRRKQKVKNMARLLLNDIDRLEKVPESMKNLRRAER